LRKKLLGGFILKIGQARRPMSKHAADHQKKAKTQSGFEASERACAKFVLKIL
jgi:hypothetical protein